MSREEVTRVVYGRCGRAGLCCLRDALPPAKNVALLVVAATDAKSANFPRVVAAVCDFSAIVQTRRISAGNSVDLCACGACARARPLRSRGTSIATVFPCELFTRRHFVRARPREPPYCDPRLVLRFCGFQGRRGARRA